MAERSRITRTGSTMGTAAYMSPEQTRGKDTDRRTDIWSFGAVLYEMIAGRPPFRGTSDAAIARAILDDDPEPLTAQRAGLPPELDRIVKKLLAKNPADRYQHIEDAMVDLRALRGRPVAAEKFNPFRRYVLAGVSVLVLAAAGGWLALRDRGPGEARQIRTLAVLPLRPVGGPAGDLEIGIADTIITKVSQIRALTVRPTSAVRAFAAKDVDAVQAGAELKVEAVLEGTMQRSGPRLRIGMNLLRVADGASLWAEIFDVTMNDIFAVQDEVARRVADNLRVRINEKERQQLTRRGTNNVEAYQAYVAGMEFFDKRGTTSLAPEAISLFEKAVAADPKYALAHARLAYCEVWMAIFIEPEKPFWLARARKSIDRALELDPQLAEAYEARFEILWSVNEGFQLEEAIRQLRRVQEFNPGVGHSNLGILYAHMGLERQALAAFQRAADVDPSNTTFKARFVEGLALLGRDRDSLQASDAQNLERQVWALLDTGQLEAAESVITKTLTRTPNHAVLRGQQILLLALKARYREAEAGIGQIDRLARDRSYHHAAFAAACAYALQGKAREAVEWLQKTSDYGMPNYTLFSKSPHLAKIRNDPAFVDFTADLKKRYDRWQREFQ